MEVTHSFKDYVLKGQQHSRPSFILTNKHGGYFLGTPTSIFSMYNGLFFPFETDTGWNLVKTVSYLGIPVDAQLLDNHFSHVNLKKRNAEESFYMNHANVLMYDVTNYEGKVSLHLDCKQIYDGSTTGRVYELYEESDCIVIKYIKYGDEALTDVSYTMYLAIKTNMVFSVIEKWFEQQYDLDASRGTNPVGWHFNALDFVCGGSGSVAIAYAETKVEAVQSACNAYENKQYLKRAKKNYQNSLLQTTVRLPVGEMVAYNCAVSHFDSLVQNIDGAEGIYAGLPWFFHYWSRDEAISTIALLLQERYAEMKTILFRWLETNTQGRVANRYPGSDLGSADATGWVFFRLQQLIEQLATKKRLKEFFTQDELTYVYQQCLSRIATIESKHMVDGLIANESLETWMDTGALLGDVRDGFCIEIQALHFAMYGCARSVGKILRVNTGVLTKRANLFKAVVESAFVIQKIISDRVGDSVQRPNIFIAAYVAPELFEKDVWGASFDAALSSLLISHVHGAGIATIDPNTKLFQPSHTGENNRSYHRGDVWYWVNLLVAKVLLTHDAKKYAATISQLKSDAVFATSWQGSAGCLAEISSALTQTSEGCLSQAWSYAMLIELLYSLGQ